MTLPTELVLASSSPRRLEILQGLGLRFSVQPADVDESRQPGEEPKIYVERVARDKAEAQAGEGRLVIAADTIVLFEGEVLTKPRDPKHARKMLGRLAGREHQVLTALTVLVTRSGVARTLSVVERSRVSLGAMTDDEIHWYVGTGEPLDKAGSYAIQGLGSLFVASIDGNYSNVVGLPVPALFRLVAEAGYSLLDFRPAET